MSVPSLRSRSDCSVLADEDLIALVVEGDDRAFGVLYDRHAQVTFSLALRLLGDRTAAEDLVQEAFLGAWRGASVYSATKGSVRTWLLTIVHHKGVDRLRALSASNRRAEALKTEAVVRDDRSDLTSDAAIGSVQSESVRRELERLPQEQAQVLRLAYFGGFTHHEIAEMLALPLGTVKGRMRLALERLRRSSIGEGAPA